MSYKDISEHYATLRRHRKIVQESEDAIIKVAAQNVYDRILEQWHGQTRSHSFPEWLVSLGTTAKGWPARFEDPWLAFVDAIAFPASHSCEDAISAEVPDAKVRILANLNRLLSAHGCEIKSTDRTLEIVKL